MSLTERNLTVEGVEINELDGSDIDTTDVENNIRDAFQNSPVHGLRELEVEQDGAAILISGKVNSFYQKQLAQEVVRHIHPNLQIVNTIVVD